MVYYVPFFFVWPCFSAVWPCLFSSRQMLVFSLRIHSMHTILYIRCTFDCIQSIFRRYRVKYFSLTVTSFHNSISIFIESNLFQSPSKHISRFVESWHVWEHAHKGRQPFATQGFYHLLLNYYQYLSSYASYAHMHAGSIFCPLMEGKSFFDFLEKSF